MRSNRLPRPQALLAVACLQFIGLLALATPVQAAFPGSNGTIAFVASRDGNEEIYTMNADGTGQTNVSNNAASEVDPAWSPDGTKIAFVTLRDSNYEIYTMKSDGTDQTRLTNNATDDVAPTWSPDGAKIVFTATRDGNGEIYTMNADGTGQANVSNNPANDGYAAWSPDGTEIAFGSGRDGNSEIYTMNPDGTGQTNLTNNAASDQLPDWSPDGIKVAFATNRDSNYEIYAMSADGTNQTRLTNNTTSDQYPAWSPDGTRIAWQADPGNAEIYTMNANGSGQTNVTNASSADQFPDWQPLDLVAPETAIDSGPSGPTVDPTPTFTFSSSESGSTFECRLDAGAFGPCASPHTTNELTNGPHAFDVRATDTAGNADQTPASRSFTVSTQTAVPPGAGAPEAPQQTPKISKLKLSPTKFRPARSGASVTLTRRRTPIGTTVSYMLSTDATVTFKVERATKGRKRGGKCRKPRRGAKGGRPCIRYVAVRGVFKDAGTSGRNRFKFRGRISNRALGNGRYRLVATPSAGGVKGTAVRASFRIKL